MKDSLLKDILLAVDTFHFYACFPRIPNTREATEGLAGQFALKLQKTKWRSGVCDESVVIFYSKEDGVVSLQDFCFCHPM